MKKLMSIAAIALFVAGSSALACGSCGCSVKKADTKPACCAKKDASACCAKKGDKKCAEGCKKACCAKKGEKKCAEGCKKACCVPKSDA